jgi:hypothetical protein
MGALLDFVSPNNRFERDRQKAARPSSGALGCILDWSMRPLHLSEEDKLEITRLEEAMWRAETRFDLNFQRTRFAQDFFEFGRSGRVYQRQQLILNERQEIRATLPLDDLSIRLLDENTAQVTYNSHVEYDGVVEHARRSSIWFRDEQGWVMRFHQGTPYEP